MDPMYLIGRYVCCTGVGMHVCVGVCVYSVCRTRMTVLCTCVFGTRSHLRVSVLTHTPAVLLSDHVTCCHGNCHGAQ